MTEAGSAEECIFCRIVRGEFGTEFVAENASAVAFRDLHPQAPTHFLVVPRRHISALQDVAAQDGQLLADLLLLAVDVAGLDGVLQSGYRVLTNDGDDAGQTVKHLHFHVLGGHKLHAPLG